MSRPRRIRGIQGAPHTNAPCILFKFLLHLSITYNSSVDPRVSTLTFVSRMKYIFDRIFLEAHEKSDEEDPGPDVISSTRIPADVGPEPDQRYCVARPVTAERNVQYGSHTSSQGKDLHVESHDVQEETQCKILSMTTRKTGPIKVFSTAVDETVRVSMHQVPIQQIRRAEPSPRCLVPTHSVISNKDFDVTRVPRPCRKDASKCDVLGVDLVSTLTRQTPVLASKGTERPDIYGSRTCEEESSFLESSVSDCKRVPSSTIRNNKSASKTLPADLEAQTNDDSDNDYLYTVASTVRHPSLVVDDIRIFEVKGAVDERRKKKDSSNDSYHVIKIDMPPKSTAQNVPPLFMSSTSPMETKKYTRSDNNANITFNRTTAVRVTPTKPDPIEVTASYINHKVEGSTRAICSIETPVENPVIHSGTYNMVENASEDEVDTDFRVVEADVSDSTHSDYSDGNYCVQSRMERIRRAPVKENTYSVIKGTASRIPAPRPSTSQEGDDLRCFVLTFVDAEPKKSN